MGEALDQYALDSHSAGSVGIECTPCPYCINGHPKAALRAGATPEELMEAIWVAAESEPAPPMLIQH